MQTRCRKCNKMFFSGGLLGVNKCPDCRADEEEKFEMVREMVKLQPGISIGEVSSKTELSHSQIRDIINRLNQ